MITESQAREIAGDWHNGADSPLYAFNSSGTITQGILEEIDTCLALCTPDDMEYRNLKRLYEFALSRGAAVLGTESTVSLTVSRVKEEHIAHVVQILDDAATVLQADGTDIDLDLSVATGNFERVHEFLEPDVDIPSTITNNG